MGRKMLDLDADPRLFWDNVLIGDGCWEWQKGTFTAGYGSVRYRKKTMPASRVAWALTHGGELPPKGMFVCHCCDNPLCVRPDHLFLGSNRDNQLDKVAKVGPWQWNTGWTHCTKGHSYEVDGVYMWRGRRYCRLCCLAAQKAYRQRKKVA